MYNSVAELHIGVDIALQQLNSNRKEVIKPEEKDWLLNETMLQLINNHIDPSGVIPSRTSDSDQRAVDYLQVLKTSCKVKPVVFKGDEPNCVEIDIPADYYRKNRIFAFVSAVSKRAVNNWAIVNNSVIKVASCAFAVNSQITPAHLIDSTVISVDNRVVFDSALTKNGARVFDFSNIKSIDSKFMMIATIKEVINSLSWVSCYWEYYRNEYHPDSFVFVVDANEYFKVNKVALSNEANVSITIGAITVTCQLQNVDKEIISSDSKRLSPCRVVTSSDKDSIQSNPFLNTAFISPICVFEDGSIKIYHDETFDIAGVNLVYYRRPRLINYKTGQNCEITNDDFKIQLVNFTAQKLDAYLKGENYGNLIRENMLIL